MSILACRLTLILGLFASPLGSAAAAADEPARPVATEALHHVFQLEREFDSGNTPKNAAAFRELSSLGVKTIISVDGSPPDLQLAHEFGMRYVHLPFGYDGVPQVRAMALARAAQIATANGPVYLHCHHGRHRGPAAAAIVCRALHGWSPERAERFLQQAGTSPDYAGLFRDAKAFQPPSADTLARWPAEFPESVNLAPLVDAMVAIDTHLEMLRGAQKSAWQSKPGQPDQLPAQTAVLIWEAFRELSRAGETRERGADYTAKLADGEQAANDLRKLLSDPARDPGACDAALQKVTRTCATCHKAHRD